MNAIIIMLKLRPWSYKSNRMTDHLLIQDNFSETKITYDIYLLILYVHEYSSVVKLVKLIKVTSEVLQFMVNKNSYLKKKFK